MINKITLTLFLAACVVANSAEAQMKLLARAVNVYNGGNNDTKDSVVYFYTGTNGTGAPQYVNMPQYLTGADSIHTYSLNGTTMEMSQREIFYRTSTNIDSVIVIEKDNGAWENSYIVEISTANGKPDTARYRTWRSSSNSWRTSSYRIYTWSGNNVASEERIRRQWQSGQWNLNPDWKKTMTYSGGNTIDSTFQDYSGGNYVNEKQVKYTYTTGGRATSEESTWNNSSWETTARGFYTYDGGNGNRIQEFRSELFTGSAWEGDDSISYFYTGANTVPDSSLEFAFQFNLYSPVAKHVFEGNTANQITSERFETFNGTIYDYDGTDSTINWYYGWNVSVDDVTSEKKNIMSIYPTPASNNITIELDPSFKGKDIQFSIIDMQGRTLNTWSEGNYQSAKTISVADYPAGNYILHAGNGNVVIAERFIISK